MPDLTSYYLDSLAVEGDSAAVELALESHLYALMAQQDWRVVSVTTRPMTGPVPPPEGWVVLRAVAVVEEFEVEVELDDDGLDDPAEVFDVDVELEHHPRLHDPLEDELYAPATPVPYVCRRHPACRWGGHSVACHEANERAARHAQGR